MAFKTTKHGKEPSKFTKKLVKEEIEDDGSKPDPKHVHDKVLNQTDEELNKETETPQDREKRKQELERRKQERLTNRMESTTSKRAIFYPKGDY